MTVTITAFDRSPDGGRSKRSDEGYDVRPEPLTMAAVLPRFRPAGLLDEIPALVAYFAPVRCAACLHHPE